MWPSIRIAYGWVHQAARLLENEDEATGGEVRQSMEHLLDLRQEARRQQGRFRKDPAAYLAALENRLLKRSLPS
jgi:hypothetical protein